MTRKVVLGLVVFAVFAVGCRSTVEKEGEATPPVPVVKQPSQAPVTPTPPEAGQPYQVLRITADMPRELLDTAMRQGCPATALSSLFGVSFSSNHGCVLGSVTPGGLADKIGLKAGDSIVGCNGSEATCPRTLVPLLGTSKEPGKVELIVHRPKAG